jgi:predicted phage-related endonuclease
MATGSVLVEAKSAADMSEWGDEGTDVIPAYYLVQVQWQMHVSGIHRCYVPVIGPRLKFAEYVVDYDAESGPLLERRMREFYDSLTSDTPPDSTTRSPPGTPSARSTRTSRSALRSN